jgi:hypothetical protein
LSRGPDSRCRRPNRSRCRCRCGRRRRSRRGLRRRGSCGRGSRYCRRSRRSSRSSHRWRAGCRCGNGRSRLRCRRLSSYRRRRGSCRFRRHNCCRRRRRRCSSRTHTRSLSRRVPRLFVCFCLCFFGRFRVRYALNVFAHFLRDIHGDGTGVRLFFCDAVSGQQVNNGFRLDLQLARQLVYSNLICV